MHNELQFLYWFHFTTLGGVNELKSNVELETEGGDGHDTQLRWVSFDDDLSDLDVDPDNDLEPEQEDDSVDSGN